jgi:hypothetical protein
MFIAWKKKREGYMIFLYTQRNCGGSADKVTYRGIHHQGNIGCRSLWSPTHWVPEPLRVAILFQLFNDATECGGEYFEPKRDEVIEGVRKLHNEELHNLYSSTSIIRTINPRRVRWTGHVAHIGEKRNAGRVLVGRPEAKKHWEEVDVDGVILLKWILER